MKLQVWIGGNLPESALPELVETLQEDSVQLIDGWGVEQDPIEKILRDYQGNEPLELEFEADYDLDGIPGTMELDDYCEKCGLTLKKLLPPSVSSHREHLNECYYYQAPGMDGPTYTPTDGEGEVVMRQSDVLELLDACQTLSKRPLDDMPLLINDEDEVTKLYAKASMAGQEYEEIFKDLLITRLGHTKIELPPFKIIQGR